MISWYHMMPRCGMIRTRGFIIGWYGGPRWWYVLRVWDDMMIRLYDMMITYNVVIGLYCMKIWWGDGEYERMSWYDQMMRWYGDMVWYDDTTDMMTWRYEMKIWYHITRFWDDDTIWWYDGIGTIRCGEMMMWYDDMIWSDDMVIWHNGLKMWYDMVIWWCEMIWWDGDMIWSYDMITWWYDMVLKLQNGKTIWHNMV